jgi:hypothetical protein
MVRFLLQFSARRFPLLSFLWSQRTIRIAIHQVLQSPIGFPRQTQVGNGFHPLHGCFDHSGHHFVS